MSFKQFLIESFDEPKQLPKTKIKEKTEVLKQEEKRLLMELRGLLNKYSTFSFDDHMKRYALSSGDVIRVDPDTTPPEVIERADRMYKTLAGLQRAIGRNEAKYRKFNDHTKMLDHAQRYNTRVPEFEPLLLTNPLSAYSYANSVIHGRWPEGEAIIKTSPLASYWYAKNVIEGRWPEGEATILKDEKQWKEYKKFLEEKGTPL